MTKFGAEIGAVTYDLKFRILGLENEEVN